MSQNREETEKSNINPPPIMTEKSSSPVSIIKPQSAPSNIDIIDTDTKENNDHKNKNKNKNKNKSKSNNNNLPFNNDLNEIYKHIENKTITKEIFESFWSKIQSQFTDYQQKIENLQKINKSGKKIKDQTPELPDKYQVDVEKLIKDNLSSQVVAFENIEGRSPKIKELYIEFYPQFLTFIPQKKCDQNALKTVIYYEDIEKIVCVPEKNTDMILYCQLKHKIKLKTQKRSIESLVLIFEDLSDPQYNDEIEEIDICNMNTTLPSKLRGHEEDLFCRVMKELCHKEIYRHNKQLFKTVDTQNKQNNILYFIECHYKNNKCCVYPLRAGLFMQPKPMKFYPSNTVQYYEYTRQAQGLRYFDMDIILYPEDEEEEGNNSNSNSKEENNDDDKKKKNKKKKDKSLVIELSMISVNDMPAIELYFAQLNIPKKVEGRPSPDRRKKTQSRIGGGGDEDSDMDDSDDEEYDDNHNRNDDEMDLDESDDEEFNPESDDGSYGEDTSDGEDKDDDDDGDDSMSDATANPEDFSDDEDEEDDMDESEDIDINELKDVIKNVELAQKGEKLGAGSYPSPSPSKQNKNKNKNKNKNTKKSPSSRKSKKVVRKKVDNDNKKTAKATRKSKKPVKKELNKNKKKKTSPKKKTKTPTRKSKKRSRDEMESDTWNNKKKSIICNKDNPIEIKDDSDDSEENEKKKQVRQIVNMFHPSKRMRIGRKSTDYGKKSGKIVSKTIAKKIKNGNNISKSNSIEIVDVKYSPVSNKRKKKKSLQNNSPSPLKKNNKSTTASSSLSDKENKPKKTRSKTKAKKIKNKTKTKDNNKDNIVSLIDDDDHNQRKISDMFKSANC